MTCIYRIDLSRGYFYIGQSINIHKRFQFHLWLLKNNKHSNTKMQRIYNKYGVCELKIICICSKNDLNDFEQVLLSYHDNNIFMCNIAKNILPRKDVIVSEETRKKLSLSLSGKKRTPEQVQAMRMRLVGIKRSPRSEQTKLKISLKNSGKNNGMYGKKMTESAKIKQRQKLIGDNNYLAKPILNTQTGIYYATLQEAADTCNIQRATLSWHLCGKSKKNKTDFIYA